MAVAVLGSMEGEASVDRDARLQLEPVMSGRRDEPLQVVKPVFDDDEAGVICQ